MRHRLAATRRRPSKSVAGDVQSSRDGIRLKLSQFGRPLDITLLESAEEVAAHWEGFDLLVLGNNFGGGEMTGSELVQLIRRAEEREAKEKFIILCSADKSLENPGANLMW